MFPTVLGVVVLSFSVISGWLDFPFQPVLLFPFLRRHGWAFFKKFPISTFTCRMWVVCIIILVLPLRIMELNDVHVLFLQKHSDRVEPRVMSSSSGCNLSLRHCKCFGGSY